MASKYKKGKYGMTQPRIDNVIGTAVICSGPFADIKGEITSERHDYLRYLTIQVPSEYPNRVYIVNLLHNQCRDIQMRYGY